jgi:uncharacterized membrane protein
VFVLWISEYKKGGSIMTIAVIWLVLLFVGLVGVVGILAGIVWFLIKIGKG